MLAVRDWIRRHNHAVRRVALLIGLAIVLSGFGGIAQPALPELEPQSVGRVTNLSATAVGQTPGSVKIAFTQAENAQVHFVAYIKTADAAARNYGAARIVSLGGAEGVIEGLESGTPYVFTAIGMRWNWIQFGTVWGQWSRWGFATPTGQASMQSSAEPPVDEPTVVGPVTSVAVANAAEPGAARVTWSPAQNAQVHFVVYIRSQDRASRNFATARMVPFVGSEGVIRGLAEETSYDFIAVGMRWNWINFGAVWGSWSRWTSTTLGPAVPIGPPSLAVEIDRPALVALYNATGGPNWSNNANWLSDRPLGEWHGVTTHANGRVAEIRLAQNRLSGTIPPQLGDLNLLARLSLSQNGLHGPIPPELGRLSSLTSLELNSNRLTGRIPPELANLQNLSRLYLSQNFLAGCIPPDRFRLKLDDG